MIRTALLDPKGQRRFANALLAGETEVPAIETCGADQAPRPSSIETAARPILRRVLYPK